MAKTKKINNSDLKGKFQQRPYATGQERGGKFTGELSVSELYGNFFKTGLIYEMRYKHPLIKAAMDERKLAVSTLEYEIVPSSDNYDSIYAAILFENIFKNMAVGNLNSFLSQAYDYLSTYGFIFYEFHFDEKMKLRMIPIEPWAIEEWTMDEWGVDPISFKLAGNEKLIPSENNFVWYGEQTRLDDFRGTSALVALARDYAMYLETVQIFLQERKLNKGFMFLQEDRAHGEADDADIEGALEWASDIENGINYSVPFLPATIKPSMISIDSAGINTTQDVVMRIENTINKTLIKNVNALGNVGSYARAIEISEEDRENAKNHIEHFLKIINGDFHYLSKTLLRLGTFFGIKEENIPRIVAKDNTSMRTSERIENLGNALDIGIIKTEDIDEDTIDNITNELGVNKNV